MASLSPLPWFRGRFRRARLVPPAALILLVGACAGGTGSSPSPSSQPKVPRIQSVAVTPAIPVAAVTELTIHAEVPPVTDANLEYAWNFGDGTATSGNDARHLFADAGDYVVALSVTAHARLGGQASASASRRLTAASLTGWWEASSSDRGLFLSSPAFRVTQAGSEIVGEYGSNRLSLDPPDVGSIVFAGTWTISHDRPGHVRADGSFDLPVGPGDQDILAGTLASSSSANCALPTGTTLSFVKRAD